MDVTTKGQWLGPEEPYDKWFRGLDPQHQTKEGLRRKFLAQADAGQEIPIPVIFQRDTGETHWVFEYECPCRLWPDDLANKQRVVLDSRRLEGEFECVYCKREWSVVSWEYIDKSTEVRWHPRVLHCALVGTMERLRLLISQDPEQVALTTSPRVSAPMKLALLLRTLDDE